MIPSSIRDYQNTEPQLFDRMIDSMNAEEEATQSDTYEPLPINYGQAEPMTTGDIAPMAQCEGDVVRKRSASVIMGSKRKRESVCPSLFMDALKRDSMLDRGARASFLSREAPHLFRGSFALAETTRDSFWQKIDNTIISDMKSALITEPQTPVIPATPPKKKQKKSATKQKEVKWLAMLEALKRYKTEYGDCIVPRGWSPNPKLASWVAEQRKQYKLMADEKPTNITPERVQLLEEVGFSWNAQEAAWAKHFANLLTYKQRFGNCLVPLSYKDSPQLGLWVKEQRRHYALLLQGRKSHITEDRIEKLESIGFCWDSHEAVWWDRYRELELYRSQFGDCLVPTKYDSNPRLGTWVHHQRRQYRKLMKGQASHMTHERVEALSSIDFCWFPREDGASASRRQQPDDDESIAGFDFLSGEV